MRGSLGNTAKKESSFSMQFPLMFLAPRIELCYIEF